MNQEINFVASVHRLSTDASGGWKLVLEVPESESKNMLTMAVLKGVVLNFNVTEDENAGVQQGNDGE